jgi:hypothetical protein
MTWSVADLVDRRGRRGWVVSPATVNRTLHALGDRYRRSRNDLTHRLEGEAVPSAQLALAELHKRGASRGRFRLVSVDECDLHTHPHLAPVRQRRIIRFWLPAHTPTRLIERVWRNLKRKLACHRFWAGADGPETDAANLLAPREPRFPRTAPLGRLVTPSPPIQADLARRGDQPNLEQSLWDIDARRSAFG